MDWGLAKVLTGAEHAPAQSAREIRTIRTGLEGCNSAAGTISGTPAYMAPEQARGENERVNKRADVFALGSILCEILTGKPAYVSTRTQDTYFHALTADLRDANTRLDDCAADPQLVELARRCLEPEPAARLQDAGVLAVELTAYFNGVQERLRQAELERAATQARAAAEKRSRRLKSVLAGLLVLTALGLALGAWWSYDRRARLRHEVESDLTAAELAEANGQWTEARAAAERAQGRLGGSGPADLQRRLQRVRDDLDMVAQLDLIRLKQADVTDGRYNREAAVSEYAAAFQKYDLDVLALDSEEAARRLRGSAITDPLLAALDDWLLLLDANDRHWQHLFDVVQRADADSRQVALRATWATQDWTTLRDLAKPQIVAELPPTTALFVSGALLRAQAPDEAIHLLEAAQRSHPADFWLNHRLGYMLDHITTHREEAVGYYRAALALRPNSPGVYVNLTVALEGLGRYDEAEDAARKAILCKDDYAEAYTNLAFFLRRRQRFEEAEETLQKALALKPRLAVAHWSLFRLRDEEGRFDEADAAMRQALDLEPDNPALHHDYGAFLLRCGRIADAKNQFETAVALKPDQAAYHFQLAYALTQLGARKQGEHEYRAGLALDDHAALAHTNLGALLFEQGRYADAEQEHRAAIAADPKLHVAYLNLGITLARRDKLAEGEKAFQDAIDRKADYGAAHFQLGMTQLRQGKNAPALEQFREALRYGFDNADVHGQYGVALARQGQHTEAESEFRRALALAGDVPEWQCRLGQALCEQGRFREGRDLLRKGHERATRQAGWNLPSEQWLKTAERNAELEEKLPAVLADGFAPRDGGEWLEYAAICQAKRQYASAVKCYQGAFAANPKLATDYRAGGRSAAARAAVLAASGQGVEALDDASRARLRQQALAWLQADIAGWSRSLDSIPASREKVRQALAAMRIDPALAAVRDDAALDKMPAMERADFRQLWQRVGELSRRVEENND
jgi:Tfp pilus assembly protein PilF